MISEGIQRGLYRHWKGGVYWVEGVAHSVGPKGGNMLVIYAKCDPVTGKLDDKWWARDIKEFKKIVGIPPNAISRFQFLRHTIMERGGRP